MHVFTLPLVITADQAVERLEVLQGHCRLRQTCMFALRATCYSYRKIRRAMPGTAVAKSVNILSRGCSHSRSLVPRCYHVSAAVCRCFRCQQHTPTTTVDRWGGPVLPATLGSQSDGLFGSSGGVPTPRGVPAPCCWRAAGLSRGHRGGRCSPGMLGIASPVQGCSNSIVGLAYLFQLLQYNIPMRKLRFLRALQALLQALQSLEYRDCTY